MWIQVTRGAQFTIVGFQLSPTDMPNSPIAMVLTLLTGLLFMTHGDGGFTVVRPAKASDFLDSIGVNSAINSRGETLAKTIECARYLGVRWFRSGIEGTSVQDAIALHAATGCRVSWSPGSGGADLPRLLETGREVAKAGALLAFEGPNEPNNWALTYKGMKGGGSMSWRAVAMFQSDLYRSVKSDPVLRTVPVWGISECGAETDNVGLQFLAVPAGAGTLADVSTHYADAANVHNYFYHPNSPDLADNKTWDAADPTSACRVDGLNGEVGLTWLRHFKGYSNEQLASLKRVTTETGVPIGGQVTEEIHALNILSLYLDQFARGFSHTALYLLRDRVDEAGNQQFGLYRPDYTPRKAAVYLHNLTTILADKAPGRMPKTLRYSLSQKPNTLHDLLLEKADGTQMLILWSERLTGVTETTLTLDHAPKGIKLYDPTVGTEAIRDLGHAKAISLSLTDHPVIISIQGR